MAAEVKARLSLDSSPFVSGLKKAETEAMSFGASLGKLVPALGYLTAGAGLVALAKGAIEAGAEIYDLSRRVGIGTDTMQRLKRAAIETGGNLETVSRAMLRLERSAFQAAAGGGGTTLDLMVEDGEAVISSSSKMAAAFERLGIKASELKGMSLEDMLLRMASGFAESADRGAAVESLFTIMGRAAGDLIPIFEQGEEALRKMLSVPVKDAETIASLKQMDMQLEAIGRKLKAIGGAIAIGLGHVWDGVVDKGRQALETIELGARIPFQGFDVEREIKTGWDKAKKSLSFFDKSKELVPPLTGAVKPIIVNTDDIEALSAASQKLAFAEEQVASFKFSQLAPEEQLRQIEADRVKIAGELIAMELRKAGAATNSLDGKRLALRYEELTLKALHAQAQIAKEKERAEQERDRDREQLEMNRSRSGQETIRRQEQVTALQERLERERAEGRVLAAEDTQAVAIKEQMLLIDRLKAKHDELVATFADEREILEAAVELEQERNRLTGLTKEAMAPKRQDERGLAPTTIGSDQFARVGWFAGQSIIGLAEPARETARNTAIMVNLLRGFKGSPNGQVAAFA